MENNTGQQNRPQASTSFFCRLKRNPMTVVALLLVAMLVLSVAAVASMVGAKKKPTDIASVESVAVPPTTDTATKFAKLQSDVKALLFDINVGKDAITEETIPATNGLRTYILTVRTDAANMEGLRQSVVNVMNAGKFAPLYVAEPYHLVMADTAYRYELVITDVAPAAVATNPATPDVPVVSNVPVTDTPSALVLPPASSGQIALLIDDAGQNLVLAERLLRLNTPITLAILPHMQYTRETADLLHANGQEVFLHFPMEPQRYPDVDPGNGAVLVNMPELLIAEVVKQNMENIGPIDGFNNHMGSAFTEDVSKMTQVLNYMQAYTPNFVDSNTSAQTVAEATCRDIGGYYCGLNRKFLDNENDHNYIRQKLYDMATLASKGTEGVIAIGHLRPDTVAVLEQVIPELQAMGYQFVFVTDLLKQ
jgi:polysaccharide deacetylase 2 family uncharacterized protein YibQ